MVPVKSGRVFITTALCYLLCCWVSGHEDSHDKEEKTYQKDYMGKTSDKLQQAKDDEKIGIVAEGGNDQKHNNSFIGFTAYKQSTQMVDFGDIVEFDEVLVNAGGHYDPSSSRFTCPHDGVYFIAHNYKCTGTIPQTLVVVVGTEEVFYTFNIHVDIPWNIVSNSGVMRCKQGEYIMVKSDSSGAVYGEAGTPQTTLTVIMMYQDGANENNMHTSFVGFSAEKIGAQEYNPGDRIVIDEVLCNEGGYYSPNASHFQCPVDGVYYVTGTYWKLVVYDLSVGIEKSGIMMLHSEDMVADNRLNAISNSRVVRCTAGEYIAVTATGDGMIEGLSNQPVTTFSVMLMHQEETVSDGSIQHSSFVGFSAFKTTNQNYNTTGTTITFDGVLLNDGDFYEPSLSRFVCPVNSTYYVAVTFVKLDSEPLQVEVQRDTFGFLRVEETEAENPWNTVSNSALVECTEGQSIWVKAVGPGSVHGDPSKAFTTFTVMKMY